MWYNKAYPFQIYHPNDVQQQIRHCGKDGHIYSNQCWTDRSHYIKSTHHQKDPYNKTILCKEISDNIDVQKKLSSQMAAAVCASAFRGNIDYGASLHDNISPQHPYMPWLYSK